jgi:hypothetical protein
LAEVPPLAFLELKDQYPAAYESAFPGLGASEAFAQALRRGHKIYVGEACWHCHSQQVRPWGGDEARFGRRSFPEEYHNELNMPPLWGTRRIGPDLIRRGGTRSNDWHVAHFYHPPDVSPVSVMPSYPWFLEPDGKTPNKRGLSIIAYVQWLGSWIPSLDETVYEASHIDTIYPSSGIALPVRPVDPAAVEEAGEEEEGDFWGDE